MMPSLPLHDSIIHEHHKDMCSLSDWNRCGHSVYMLVHSNQILMCHIFYYNYGYYGYELYSINLIEVKEDKVQSQYCLNLNIIGVMRVHVNACSHC